MCGARAHDHGASYVVYGLHRGGIEQTKYKWAYEQDGRWMASVMKPGDYFIQNAGEVALFLSGEIHRTTAVSKDPPIVLWLEGQFLDRVVRHSCNLESDAAVQLYG